jgi:hypothetical protein
VRETMGMTPELKSRLASALYRVMERLGADFEVLAAIGSFGDTLDDEDVVDLLEDWLERGFTLTPLTQAQ